MPYIPSKSIVQNCFGCGKNLPDSHDSCCFCGKWPVIKPSGNSGSLTELGEVRRETERIVSYFLSSFWDTYCCRTLVEPLLLVFEWLYLEKMNFADRHLHSHIYLYVYIYICLIFTTTYTFKLWSHTLDTAWGKNEETHLLPQDQQFYISSIVLVVKLLARRTYKTISSFLIYVHYLEVKETYGIN